MRAVEPEEQPVEPEEDDAEEPGPTEAEVFGEDEDDEEDEGWTAAVAAEALEAEAAEAAEGEDDDVVVEVPPGTKRKKAQAATARARSIRAACDEAAERVAATDALPQRANRRGVGGGGRARKAPKTLG